MRKPSSSSWETKLGELLSRPNVGDLYEGLRDLLAELINALSPVAILVIGSLARGEFVRGMSDIDLLILIERAPGKQERFFLRNVRGVDVEIVVYGLGEAVRSAEEGNPLILDALRNGVVIYGHLTPELEALSGSARRTA